MKKSLLALAATAILVACNGLVGNDSVTLGNPDAGAQDGTMSDGSGSGGDGSGGDDSTAADSGSGSSSGSDSGSGSGVDSGSSSGADSGHDTGVIDAGKDVSTDDGGADADAAAIICTANTQLGCSGNQPLQCNASGTGWQNLGTACSGSTPVCVAGACVACNGGTNPVPCGNCNTGTDTQTCVNNAWQSSGTCTGQGCAATTMQSCNTYGSQTCSAGCTWGNCTCPSGATCSPNGTQSCNTYGTQTCNSTTCVWDACSCPLAPVCVPSATQCSGSQIQTCNACGQWGTATSCGASSQCCGGVGGTCVNTQTNANNCGYCGHDCAACSVDGVSPTCAAGACQAMTLATDTNPPTGIATDGTNTYWAEWISAGTIKQCTSTGCAGAGGPTLLASGQNSPSSVATDGTYVYWVNFSGGQVMQCKIGGCGLNPTTLMTGLFESEHIIASNGWVYWEQIFSNPSNGAVQGCPVASCNSGTVVTFGATNQDPNPIALDPSGATIYWGNYYGCPSPPCGGSPILSCLTSGSGCGGSPTTVANTSVGVMGIAVDSTNAYWTALGHSGGGPVGVFQCALSGLPCTPAPIDNGTANSPQGIAIDTVANAQGKRYVYWVNNIANGGVMAAPVNGGTVKTIGSATNTNTPQYIAVDTSCVYWTQGNGTSGAVMKVTKP